MSEQFTLRNELCAVLIKALMDERVTQIEAVVACMGAAAVVLGTCPPKMREQIALELDGKLLEHANQRAKEIRSGAFDREVAGT